MVVDWVACLVQQLVEQRVMTLEYSMAGYLDMQMAVH